jgi:hypothetical protein
MIPTRQLTGFPTVAKIRKGMPKRKTERGETMGPDLKNRFRIEFLPGTNLAAPGEKSVREKFHALHEKEFIKYPENFVTREGYELTFLQATIPCHKVWDGWRWFNETYNAAGMRIAQADNERYLIKKNPMTMELMVKDGEPYTPFNVGDAISYKRDDKEYKLKMKSIGKLDLMLPELGEMVSFELRTTSYIDSLLIHKNLMAIQGIADILNGGIVAGIPLDIYRVEMDSPWHKDGVAHKGKQWFIQIKANAEWANAAIKRMNNFALAGAVTGFLQPPTAADVPADLPSEAMEDGESSVEDGDTVSAVVESNVSADEETMDKSWMDLTTELPIESMAPGPMKMKPNETITDGEWTRFGELVQKAENAGVKGIPEYKREKMTASTVNGATQWLKGKMEALKK